MIRVWGGYVSPADSRVTIVTFEGKRLGGTVTTVDGATVERTFYRTCGGRVVVHEVVFGKRRGGRTYDQALVYVFSSVDEACASLAVHPQHIDPRRYNPQSRRVNAPDAPVLTLDEWARGAGTY